MCIRDSFMGMVKKHGIGNICHPNALVTLKEYAVDYASEKTAAHADELIKRELENIPNPDVRDCLLYTSRCV